MISVSKVSTVPSLNPVRKYKVKGFLEKFDGKYGPDA
jgi:hypothetical protein